MTSPARILRQSPSGRKLGAFGFARLSLSAAAAYLDGVARQIPFDVIDDMSEGFGELVVGGPLVAAGAFRLTSTGIYLVTTLLTVSDPGTGVQLEIAQGAGGGGMGGDITTVNSLSVVGNGVIASVAGSDGDITSLMQVTGASNNMVPPTSCLIVQVG